MPSVALGTPTYLATWKQSKLTFERSSPGQKKPSEKFLGLFRKSSGLESATAKIDTAIRANNPTAVIEAHASLRTTISTYAKTLQKGLTKDDAAYKKSIEKLITDLDDLAMRAADDADFYLTTPRAVEKVSDALGPIVTATIGKIAFHKSKALETWLNDKSASQVFVGGKLVKHPPSAKVIVEAKACYERMKAELKQFKDYLSTQDTRESALKRFEVFAETYSHSIIENMTEDSLLFGRVGGWLEAQQEAFGDDDAKGGKLWSLKSPAWAAMQTFLPLRKNEEDCSRTLTKQIKELSRRYPRN